MAAELRIDVGTLRHDREALLTRVADEGIDQRGSNALPANLGRHERMIGHPRLAPRAPGQAPYRIAARHDRAVLPVCLVAFVGDFDAVDRHGASLLLPAERARR